MINLNEDHNLVNWWILSFRDKEWVEIAYKGVHIHTYMRVKKKGWWR